MPDLLYHRKNPNAHLTAMKRERPSFPVRALLERDLISGRVLDFGCGHGRDVEHLHDLGYDVTGYDPHYATTRTTMRSTRRAASTRFSASTF